MRINNTVLLTVDNYKMINEGDNIVVGVSGGADSMALLTVLYEEKNTLGIGELIACHLNHNLRGEESDRDENAVRRYCEQLSIKLIVEQGRMNDNELPKGESVESYARKLRYEYFQRVAEQYNAKIATAHNKNDVAETVLFNLARGTGIKGIRGVPAVRDNVIRPLMDVSRKEVESYCYDKKIPYENDSSNFSDEYSRNKIRHHVIPVLEEINENAVNSITRFARQAEEALHIFEINNNRIVSRTETERGFDISILKEYEMPEIRFFLKSLIEKFREPSMEIVELSEKLIFGDLNEMQLTDGIYLSKKGNILFIRGEVDDTEFAPFANKLKPGVNSFVPGVTVCVKKEELKNKQNENFSESVLNNAIDCDRIIGNVMLRNRRPGDSFTSNKRNNTKTLKKLFNEREIPVEKRDETAIISDDEGILWIAGEGVSKRAAVNENTKKIYIIEVQQGER